MPQDIRDATVSIEDSRFYKHHGVDYEGVVRQFTIDKTTALFTGTPTAAFDTNYKCTSSTLACQPESKSIGATPAEMPDGAHTR